MAIIDLIKSHLSPEFISTAATQLGESESKVSKAINGLLPAVLQSLTDNPTVLDTITDSASSGFITNSSENPTLKHLISSIFGDRLDNVIELVSQHSGVKKSSASALMNDVAAATMETINKYATQNNLDKNNISKLLSEQKGLITAVMPAGLSLESFGFDAISENANQITNSETEKIKPIKSETKNVITEKNTSLSNSKNKSNGSFWKWLVPIILLGIAIWFFWNQYQNKENIKTSTPIIAKDSVKNKVTDSITKDTAVILLPSGKTINAQQNGIEEQLVQFLKSDEYKNASEEKLKSKWFNFDHLNFEANSEKLTQDSQKQVDNLKSILAEFPEAKIKIGVFTDKAGDDNANLALSQKRADAVKAAIGSTQVTDAKGYGEQFAKVDEKASDKEREADRKSAIRLTK